jgi:hypothetical protein
MIQPKIIPICIFNFTSDSVTRLALSNRLNDIDIFYYELLFYQITTNNCGQSTDIYCIQISSARNKKTQQTLVYRDVGFSNFLFYLIGIYHPNVHVEMVLPNKQLLVFDVG